MSRLATTLMAVLLAGGVLAVPLAGRASAASCHIVCDGVNPNAAAYEDSNGVLRRCAADARTIYRIGDDDVWVELRYSRKCRMAWARGGPVINLLGSIHIWVQGFNSNGSRRVQYDVNVKSPRDPQGWTQVVDDAGLTARACYFDPGLGLDHCGPKY